jgi:aldehyde dehydrogenase (NAD+)
VIPFDSDEEAIAIANDSIYGLAAGVWTSNIGRALKMAHELEAGTVWTNTYRVSSPLSPFGGYKRSGFGRESGLLAIREFVQEKSVWIETTGADTPNPFVIR